MLVLKCNQCLNRKAACAYPGRAATFLPRGLVVPNIPAIEKMLSTRGNAAIAEIELVTYWQYFGAESFEQVLRAIRVVFAGLYILYGYFEKGYL